ncbi:MAG: Aspartyl/glutamyl-tRNA(Asn/Gln) amidotransferase subunit B [Chlamydiae bacterium]|nr:Aspartyl/glutamyl-tRNA(Asn/Gln) amidotransferase subunit B [Chlamydiota bacterium]
MDWICVIGLEIHVQLNTKAKIFDPSFNRFGDEPNVNISYLCTGQPGTLPVLNEEVVKKGVQFGLAIEANIAPFCKFDRKSYFYPDLPKNFQITQYDMPLILGGKVHAFVNGEEKTFEINHAHLEEDTGMLKHFSNFSGVDYNRAGTPLIEIVSEPCMHSPQEAAAFALQVKHIMQYIDASDCNMDEGSLRVDCNVSVKKKEEKGLRTKVEIKNVNSFNFLQKAIQMEIDRQIELYEKYPQKDPEEVIFPCTYRFDTAVHKNVLMRKKETAADYRFFPEPDLVPIVLSDEYIQEIFNNLPELPHSRFKRYLTFIPEESATILVSNKQLSNYFEQALNSYDKNPQAVANWITVEFSGRLKPSGKTLLDTDIVPEFLALLVEMIDEKIITGKIAKQVADEMLKNPKTSPRHIVENNPNFKPLADTKEISQIVDQVLEDNPQSIEDFKNGKDRAFGFLVGQVMKKTQGKADPTIVTTLLKSKLE